MNQMSTKELETLAHALLPLVERAGHLLCGLYKTNIDIIAKPDGSPVTEADQKSHDMIEAGLLDLAPNIQVISEEGDLHIPQGDTFWLVDPLDGTKGFIRHTGEFCINIALIQKGQPVLGCIHVPLTGETCVGYAQSEGFCKDRKGNTRPLREKGFPAEGLRVVVGFHAQNKEDQQNQFLRQFPLGSITQMGSAMKFCELGKGTADLFVRFLESYEWDTAAGQAIVEACGGHVLNLDKTPLTYGKQDLLNSSFVAICDDYFNWS